MGYFEIGIYQPRSVENIGTLWRSAYQLGAAGIFVIGRSYRKQTSDTESTLRLVPLRHYYLGNQDEVQKAMDAVANQGKAK